MRRPSRISFVRFCGEMLKLQLTPAWLVLLAVTIDGVQPRQLEGEEREIARALFGDVEEVDPRLRRVLVWRLGRASGKTTIAAALCIYGAWTANLSHIGRGQVPVAYAVSPTARLAKITVTIARELVRASGLDRYVQDDTAEGFGLRRSDGRLVEIRSVAASRGGQNLRGRDVIALVLDEAEFFASNEDGADGYAVTDGDQLDAAMPRLLEFALFIGTPWPTANRAAELFDQNFGHPVDAVVAVGPSMFMRPTEQLAQDRAREMERDVENAEREYDCVPGVRGGSRLFDAQSIDAAIVEDRPLVIRAPEAAIVGCGGDVAFERDSSVIAFVARSAPPTTGMLSGAVFLPGIELLEFEEVRPSRGAPLVPSVVLRETFAPLMRKHGVRTLMADAHYRQTVIEHLIDERLAFVDLPAGAQGKLDTYLHVRELLRSGRLRIPRSPKLIAQMRAVVSTPMPQGITKITSPRRSGSGHGDIVSALVAACWAVRVDAVAGAERARWQLKRDYWTDAFRRAESVTPQQKRALREDDALKARERRMEPSYAEKVAGERARALENWDARLRRGDPDPT